MSNGILIVEHPSLLQRGEGIPAPLTSEWADVRRISWDCFAPEQLRSSSDGLVIANAVAGAEKAAAFFAGLRDHPSPIPIFAILPDENGALLKAAAETVDDFLIWPARAE